MISSSSSWTIGVLTTPCEGNYTLLSVPTIIIREVKTWIIVRAQDENLHAACDSLPHCLVSSAIAINMPYIALFSLQLISGGGGPSLGIGFS